MDKMDSLPPFLFSKRPIKQCPSSSHSAISDIIPNNSKSTSLTNGLSTTGNNIGKKNFSHNVDYDEQIRAPRMSQISLTSYDKRNSYDKRSSLGKDSLNSTETTATSISNSPKEDKVYLPAKFDLSQPTRRFSTCSKNSVSDDILSYTTDNYIYERNKVIEPRASEVGSEVAQTQQELLKALENLNNNVTSQEREGNRIKNRIQPNQRHYIDLNGSNLKQVYELKKPLIIPAVLRPTISNDDCLTPSPSSNEDLDSPTGMKIKAFPLPRIDSSLETSTITTSSCELIEPTHQHWKPNSFTNHCMKCLGTFNNFFHPQRKRRHHCRFCGYIFCNDCLYKSVLYPPSDQDDDYISGVMMDSMARLVIPIFKLIKNEEYNRFKFCKICKDCGGNYSLLLNHLKNLNETSSIYFIENPYLKKFLQQQQEEQQLQLQKQQKQLSPKPDIDRRHSSIGQVPNDWTWSSF